MIVEIIQTIRTIKSYTSTHDDGQYNENERNSMYSQVVWQRIEIWIRRRTCA